MRLILLALFAAGGGLSLLLSAGGTGHAQPAAQDYFPFNKRDLKVRVEYTERRNEIREVQLYVSRDKGGTWAMDGFTTPDKDFIPFLAREDGLYWFHMVIVYTSGERDPADLTRLPPMQKVLIDTTPPVVKITTAKPVGDEVEVSWTYDDAYPSEGKTQVFYRPPGAGDGAWQEAKLADPAKRTTKFKPAVAGPIQVAVVGRDLVGNETPATQDVSFGPGGATAAFAPPAPTPPGGIQPAGVGLAAPPALSPPADAPAMPTGPLPPPNLGIATDSLVQPPPAPTPPSLPAPAAPPPAALPSPPTPPSQPTWTQATAPEVKPAAATATPAPPSGPIAVGSGVAPPNPGPSTAYPVPGTPTPAEPSPVQVVNFLRFDLPYDLQAGLSGVSRIDLWATRDDGQTWGKWSQHGGKESPLKVALDTRGNPQPEGDYGFRLVPVSGAGISDTPPAAGTPPDFRVRIDLTPPVIKIFEPRADPADPTTLTLLWEATDRNFGRDPVSVEWGESAAGPWRSVAGGDALASVAAAPGGGSQRVPNTGSFAWKVPAGLGTHKVFLKVSAVDAAGNRSEVVTPQPILVDLVKPRARIQGIMVPAGVR